MTTILRLICLFQVRTNYRGFSIGSGIKWAYTCGHKYYPKHKVAFTKSFIWLNFRRNQNTKQKQKLFFLSVLILVLYTLVHMTKTTWKQDILNKCVCWLWFFLGAELREGRAQALAWQLAQLTLCGPRPQHAHLHPHFCSGHSFKCALPLPLFLSAWFPPPPQPGLYFTLVPVARWAELMALG